MLAAATAAPVPRAVACGGTVRVVDMVGSSGWRGERRAWSWCWRSSAEPLERLDDHARPVRNLVWVCQHIPNSDSDSFAAVMRRDVAWCAAFQFPRNETEVVWHFDSTLQKEQLEIPRFVFQLHLRAVAQRFTMRSARPI